MLARANQISPYVLLGLFLGDGIRMYGWSALWAFAVTGLLVCVGVWLLKRSARLAIRWIVREVNAEMHRKAQRTHARRG